MEDGLYVVMFVTQLGQGGGVFVKRGDEIRGGDSGFAYVGRFNQDGQHVNAAVHVTKHSISNASVFGPLTDFDLTLAGAVDQTTGHLMGRSPQAPGVEIAVQLRKLAA